MPHAAGRGEGDFATLALCALIAEADEARKALILGRYCSWDKAELSVLGVRIGAGAILIVGILMSRRKSA